MYDGNMKMYSIANIIILVLIAIALAFGYFIFQQKVLSQQTGNLSDSISPSIETLDTVDLTATQETTEGGFTIFIGPNTQIFGVDPDNPYKGEPPASISLNIDGVGSPDLKQPFEIFGDVTEINLQEQAIRITTDNPRNIDTEFTPRGPRISLEDIKEGDRIVASDNLDEKGLIDYRDIQFIQVLLSI